MKDHPGLDPKTTRRLARPTRRTAAHAPQTPVLLFDALATISGHDFLVPNPRPDLDGDFFLPAPAAAFVEVKVS